MKKSLVSVSAAAIAMAAIPLVAKTISHTPQMASDYKVVNTVQLGGDGFWDYLYCDSKNQRIYISRGSHVMVVDAKSLAVVGDIPDTNGVHGIAISLKDGKGFTSNGRDSTVTIFDIKTLKTLATVPVDKGPDAIVYEPKTDRVFTFNGQASTATAIDARTNKVLGSFELGGRPEFGAVDGHGGLFCNIESTSEAVSIDPVGLNIIKRWSVAPGEGPSGLACDGKTDRLFSVCDGIMVISDAKAGKVLTTVPIGQGPDAAGYDPGTGFAFSSNGDGTLTVVASDGPDLYKVATTVTTMRGARTMALNLKTHHVYLVTAKFGDAPAAQPGQRRRPPMVAGSFSILDAAMSMDSK